MKIKIEWLTDVDECGDGCCSAYAEGAKVWFDNELVIDFSPAASCFDSGVHYSDVAVYDTILEKLGHTVEHE